MTKSELVFYKNILEDLNGKREYENYQKLKDDLLIEFKIRVSIEKIKELLNELLEQPTLEEEVEDLQILYSNVC